MEQLREALDAALQQATFDGHCADEYQALVQGHSWRDEAYTRASKAKVQIAEHQRSVLTEQIRSLLDSFIDPASDRIGLAFPLNGSTGTHNSFLADGTVKLTSGSTIDNFVMALVRGAAALGVRRMSAMLDGWRTGDPVQHRVWTMLNSDGVLTEALRPSDGVRIESLAHSTDQLNEFLPLSRGRPLTDYLGRIVVTIEHPMAPALFRPGDEEEVQSSRPAEMPVLETICQALALETNSHLSPAFSWHDYGELDAGCLTNRSGTWSRASTRFRPRRPRLGPRSRKTSFLTGVSTLELDADAGLRVDQRRFRTTLMALNTADAKTRRAVSRWLSSKDTSEVLDDRFIDIRIALESLYLQDFSGEQSQEMRFRLALFAAWHLGANLSERREVRRRLREAYDMASRAVHAGHVEFNEENKVLLRDAQDLCRRGIFKLLEHGQPEDWGDLILGADI